MLARPPAISAHTPLGRPQTHATSKDKRKKNKCGYRFKTEEKTDFMDNEWYLLQKTSTSNSHFINHSREETWATRDLIPFSSRMKALNLDFTTHTHQCQTWLSGYWTQRDIDEAAHWVLRTRVVAAKWSSGPPSWALTSRDFCNSRRSKAQKHMRMHTTHLHVCAKV